MKKNLNIIHIGMPKVATTTLQINVFPFIAKKIKRKLVLQKELNKLLGKSNITNHYFKSKKFNKKNCLISFESLISIDGNPFFYEKNCQILKKTFGFNSHIVIILKNPLSFLNSVYLQNINNLNLKREKDFFLSTDEYFDFIKNNKKIYSGAHWCLEKFNQKKLINIYKKSFRKVTILKIDALKDPNIVCNLFNLTLNDSKKVISIISKKKLNKSPGVYIVNLAFFLNKVLKYFNTDLLKLYNFQIKAHKYIDKSIITNFNFLRRSLKLIFFLFNFRFIYQQIVLKIIKDKDYKVNFKKFKYFNVNRELNFYNNLPKVTYFNN